MIYSVFGNSAVSSYQRDYLGFSLGGYGVKNGRWGYRNDILGLKKSNGSLIWVSVGNMATSRHQHTAVNAPQSSIPSC